MIAGYYRSHVYRQPRVKDLPKVPTWRLSGVRTSNLADARHWPYIWVTTPPTLN